MRRRDDGSVEREPEWRARTRCASCRKGGCLYLPGDYPHRQYQPDVVADVVARQAAGNSAAEAAKPASASATSARRWSDWVANLCDPAPLLAQAARLDPDVALSGIAGSAGRFARAELGVMLDVLERFGAVLVKLGEALGSVSGLGRVLEWQHRTHDLVLALTIEPRSLSPPMVPQR
jgi:hypothetical protein